MRPVLELAVPLWPAGGFEMLHIVLNAAVLSAGPASCPAFRSWYEEGSFTALADDKEPWHGPLPARPIN